MNVFTKAILHIIMCLDLQIHTTLNVSHNLMYIEMLRCNLFSHA